VDELSFAIQRGIRGASKSAGKKRKMMAKKKRITVVRGTSEKRSIGGLFFRPGRR